MILQHDTYILVLVIVLYDGFYGTDTLMFAENPLSSILLRKSPAG